MKNNKMNTNLTTNFIFIFSIVTLCCIQAINIKVVNNENRKGVDNFSCLFGISHCLTLDYVFSHLSDCHYFQISISLLEGSYKFTLNSTITDGLFKKCPAITITGAGIHNTSIVCGVDAGFAFQSISQVKIANITFTRCGSIRNSTSVNRTSKESPSTSLSLSTALYFVYCKNVQIVNVMIEKSNSTGVVMYNTYGSLHVEGSYFNCNGNQDNSLPSNGGFYIEFVYCDPGKVDENCVHQKNSHANYIFKSNTFLSNSAINEFGGTLFYVPYRTDYYSFGRGGGLSIVFKGNASNNNIIIDDCIFNGNCASRGGGLFVDFEDYSKNNSMIINDTNFSYNLVDPENGTAGGGVSIGFVIFDPKSVEFNSIVFENCLFYKNKAFWGGGFGLYMPSEPNVINATNSLSFKNCSWIENKGLLGSAVDLHYWHIRKGGVKMQVNFSACKFCDNEKDLEYMYIVQKDLPEITSFGTGALYANGIPIIFEESVEFISNTGSALALHDTTASFSDNCTASFINNTAWEGGAVAMLGASQMWIYSNTNFLFRNNKANLRGGAICALQTSRHNLLTGGNCFFHYDNITVSSPKEWKTEYRFENNHAPTGSSIFATTLLSCAWGASFKDVEFSVLNALNWAHFSYDPSDSNTIATEVFTIKKKTTYFEVIPGKRTALPIITLDDKGNNVNRSLWLNSKNKNVVLEWGITDNLVIMLRGLPDSKTLLEMVTDSSHAVSATLPVKLVGCPPGYYFDSDKQKCQCSYFNHTQHLDGILPCDSETFTAKIKLGYFAGYYPTPQYPTPTDSNLVTGQCPRHYCKGKQQVIPLPNKSNITLLNEFFCSPSNRNGTLCGMCSNGHSVAINSLYFDCINCSRWLPWLSQHGWIMYVLTEYVPLTVFVYLVLRLDFNPHSGTSSLMVLYFQIFNLLNIYSDEDVNPPKEIYLIHKWFIRFIYGIWNLEFIGSILPPYCISTKFNTMDIVCIKYITGIYPFLLLALFFVLNKLCCFKWCKFEFKRGLAALCTLVFTKFAILSGLILSWETLSGSEHSNIAVKVVWLNGNLLYGGTTHLKYISIAVLGLIFVCVITINLLCYPFLPQKIKQRKLCSPFESFQKGYRKKGYRKGFFIKFYAGLLFIYRISIVLVFSFTIEAESIFWITIITLAFVIITAILRPYKKWKENVVAVLCFSNIVFINLLSFSNLHYSETQSNKNLQPYLWIQLILVLLPLVGFIIGKIFSLREKIQARRNRCTTFFQNDNDESNNLGSDDDDHSSTDSQGATLSDLSRNDHSYGTFSSNNI